MLLLMMCGSQHLKTKNSSRISKIKGQCVVSSLCCKVHCNKRRPDVERNKEGIKSNQDAALIPIYDYF